MKKRMIPFLMSIFMVLSLAGCGKTNVTVTFENVESIEVVDPGNIKGGSSAGAQLNVLELTAAKDGEYSLTVLLDGEECKVNITVEDGNAMVTTDPQKEFVALIK